MLSNTGSIRDRNPDVIPAGKLFSLGDKANDCVKSKSCQITPQQVQKFRTSEPGKTRIFYGRYSDPDLAALRNHGLHSKSSDMASQFINPQPKSYFEHRLNQKREENVYASQKRAPLGRSHDQRPGLPAADHATPGGKRYGLPTERGYKAAELINPLKSHSQVEEESQQGLELYKVSHRQYNVGESYDRNYDWSRTPASISFGIETPHDNRGLNAQKSLKWLNQTLSEKAAQLTSKRVDNFRERNTSQVGKVHDPIKSTLNIDPDHTHGIMVEPDQYGAGDLIHMRKTGSFLRGRDRVRGILAAVRQHLKKANYHNFADLKAAFSYYDKDKSGTIDINELRDICHQFHLPIQTDLLESLLQCCDKNADANIDYVEFSNFLNWKDKMPSGLHKVDENEKNDKNLSEDEKYERKIIAAVKTGLVDNPKENSKDKVVGVLRKQIDDYNSPSDYTTSYSLLNGIVTSNFFKTRDPPRQYGIPTIRSDLPAPRIRRMGDNANYGDQSDAYGLINPSVYSNLGVFEDDFFKARSQQDIRGIFHNIGVGMSHETFQQIWGEAAKLSSDGQVSVESFRNILDEEIAQQYEDLMRKNAENSNDTDTVLKRLQEEQAKHDEMKKQKEIKEQDLAPTPGIDRMEEDQVTNLEDPEQNQNETKEENPDTKHVTFSC